MAASLIQNLNTSPAREAALYHLNTGGHRMRARLALASAAGWLDGNDAIAAAAACELLHNASLIHDDISDRDTYRRGQPTVAARYGDDVALCAGDLLLTAAFQAAASIGHAEAARQLTSAMARCAARVIGGQSVELERSEGEWPVGFRTYLQATRDKTAPLIEAALCVGSDAMGGAKAARTPDLRGLAESIGLAYQILDDLDDLGDSNLVAPATDRLLHPLHAWWHHRPWPRQSGTETATPTRHRCLRHVEAALARAERLTADLSAPLAESVRELTGQLTQKAKAYRDQALPLNGN